MSSPAREASAPNAAMLTRNGARKAKIQTRAMSAGAKPSAAVLAAKKKAQQKKKSIVNLEIKDPYQIAMEAKSIVKGQTGFVTEPHMADHRCLWDEDYPESPQRLIKVIERCNELKLIEQCKQYTPRAATKEEVCTLHASSVYEMLEKTHNNQDVEYLEELSSQYDAIYIHPSTHMLSLVAAGSTIDLVDSVMRGEVQNGAAMVRPPGHHAMHAEPCGYCFYNNVALAAMHALREHHLTRILIVDWDVHHGQATQQMFYEDPRVLYFSVHRYEHGAFWPNLRQSDFPYVGAGRGAGFTCNVPLNATGATDGDYLAVWLRLLLPMALEGEMELSPACYAHLVHLLMGVCSRVVCVLEGGYCVQSLAEGAALTLRTLLGHAPPPLPEPITISDFVNETILNCIYVQRKYWECFKYHPTCPADSPEVHAVSNRWEGDEARPARFDTRACYPVQDERTRRILADRLDRLATLTDLSEPMHEVGYLYDEVMLKHRNICEPGHPERPERLLRIHERLRDFGVLERLRVLKAAPATDEEVLMLHEPSYLERLKGAGDSARVARATAAAWDSVYLHPASLESARAAAGCALRAVRAVLSGELRAAACALRPPGHHADARSAQGFCLLNNAALAATAAAAAGRRVLLLDWDVHHGNGTQRLTYRSPHVLYVSIHRYDGGSFFPHSREGDHTSVGEGPGEGFNVNVPWNERGMGDAEYLAAFTRVVLPIAYEFRPEVVVVSAGFDAAVGDPLGGCRVTPECFARLTALLRALAGGRLVLCLEGGYNCATTALAFTLCTKVLLGDPPPPAAPLRPPRPSAARSLAAVRATHARYWRCLRGERPLPSNPPAPPPPSRGLPPASPTLDAALARLQLHCEEDAAPTDTGAGGSEGTGSSEGAGGSRSTGGAEGAAPAQTLVEYLSEHMGALTAGDMFAVVPLAGCPHVEELPPPPVDLTMPAEARCFACEETFENWVCLHCRTVACGRAVRAHMQEHWAATGHAVVLSRADLSVWCCACDAYVDHPRLHPYRDALHRAKFGEPLPWTYRTH